MTWQTLWYSVLAALPASWSLAQFRAEAFPTNALLGDDHVAP